MSIVVIMEDEKQFKDLLETVVQFLKSDRIDLRGSTLRNLLDFTGTDAGCRMLAGNEEALKVLLSLSKDEYQPIRKDACFVLINLSAQKSLVPQLLEVKQPCIVGRCLEHILDKSSHEADPCCMILSNLTRPPDCCRRVWERMKTIESALESLLVAFCTNGYNKHGGKLHYIGPILSNLSQLPDVRHILLNSDEVLIHRLLPFTEFSASEIRRGGIIGTLRNCCFQTESHCWLLGESVDILPHLLLPLAGSETFTEEENDELPIDLQYLPEDKKREGDPDIRKMLLEALLQLCSLRQNREVMRQKGVYYILREFHKWEKDSQVKLICEDLVNILIRTEDEIGEDDLKEVQLPEEIQRKLEAVGLNSE